MCQQTWAKLATAIILTTIGVALAIVNMCIAGKIGNVSYLGFAIGACLAMLGMWFLAEYFNARQADQIYRKSNYVDF